MKRALRPDAQGYDEVRLITVPRYKTSGLSGDEWRISVVMQCFRKGVLRHEESIAHNLEIAAGFLGYKYAVACEGNGQYYAGEENWCDQEGCSQQAVVTYKLKAEYCRHGHKTDCGDNLVIRKFCSEHRERGDCGLDDADNNYEVLNDTP